MCEKVHRANLEVFLLEKYQSNKKGFFMPLIILNCIVVTLPISFFVALFVLLLFVVVSRLFFRDKKAIKSFGAVYSNTSFIGISLILSVIGANIIYCYCATAFVAILNILQNLACI